MQNVVEEQEKENKENKENTTTNEVTANVTK